MCACKHLLTHVHVCSLLSCHYIHVLVYELIFSSIYVVIYNVILYDVADIKENIP